MTATRPAPRSLADTTEAPTGEPAPVADDFELVIGQIMPETGALAFLNSPMIVSIDLAVKDIQARRWQTSAVGPATLPLIPTSPPRRSNRLLGEGAHVIVGAAASGVSQSFIQDPVRRSDSTMLPIQHVTVVLHSTERWILFQDRASRPGSRVDPGQHHRREGATNVAIPARADDWGNALAGCWQRTSTNSG